MERYEFKCEVSNNAIQYKNIGNNSAYMDYIKIDEEKSNLFFGLLNKSIDILKKRGITHIMQLVSETDWVNYLMNNNKWQIIKSEIYNDIKCKIIGCTIEDAKECIAEGLGNKKE